jgi:quercetin dioxygenase-like cupin family protein
VTGETDVKVRILTEGRFDRAQFETELRAAPSNHEVGTRVLFENEHVRVWEVRLTPGERAPFHAHTRRYFWTVVDGAIGRQRSDDGTLRVREYRVGETQYQEPDRDNVLIHDLENVGDAELRFVTVELLD